MASTTAAKRSCWFGNYRNLFVIVFLLMIVRTKICYNDFNTSNNARSLSYRPTDGAMELVEELLIKAHGDYDINYMGYKANHLSHVLYSLSALGASKSRLQEYHDMYVTRLIPLRKPNFTIYASDWMENMGNRRLYPEFLQYFDGEIKSKGQKGTFNQYESQLLGESLGGALHPLIFIGFAMEFSNAHLLSEGLAYACISPLRNTHQILDDIDSNLANSETTVVNLIEELQEIQFDEFAEIKGFHSKTQFLLRNHGELFKNLIAKWDLSQADQFFAKLNELTEASILGVFATYPKEIDFFLLHGVTGNHAVRSIFPNLSLEMQRHLLRVNLLGLLSDYVVERKPKINVELVTGYKNETEISWDSIVDKAISIDDAHVSKVVRSVIQYMEGVPVSHRSEMFTQEFLKRCAFKAVDLLPDNYIF